MPATMPAQRSLPKAKWDQRRKALRQIVRNKDLIVVHPFVRVHGDGGQTFIVNLAHKRVVLETYKRKSFIQAGSMYNEILNQLVDNVDTGRHALQYTHIIQLAAGLARAKGNLNARTNEPGGSPG